MGIPDNAAEAIIGTDAGIAKARDIRRKKEDDGCNGARFNNVRGVPRKHVPGQGGSEVRARVNMPLEDGRMPEQMRYTVREMAHIRQGFPVKTSAITASL